MFARAQEIAERQLQFLLSRCWMMRLSLATQAMRSPHRLYLKDMKPQRVVLGALVGDAGRTMPARSSIQPGQGSTAWAGAGTTRGSTGRTALLPRRKHHNKPQQPVHGGDLHPQPYACPPGVCQGGRQPELAPHAAALSRLPCDQWGKPR